MRDEIFPEYGSPNLQRYEDGAVEWKIFFHRNSLVTFLPAVRL